jgi:hypothetical protein
MRSSDGSVVVPVDEAADFGIQSGQVQRVAEQGGGYMADVFVFHDLHCLVCFPKYPLNTHSLMGDKEPDQANLTLELGPLSSEGVY